MMAIQPGPPHALMPFARAIAVVCVVVGIAAVVGWWVSMPLFDSALPGLGTLKPNTALCFILGGLSLAGLLAQARPSGATRRFLTRIQPGLALMLLLIAALTLFSYVMHVPDGIDRWLIADDVPTRLRVFPWRMSPITAISFSLLAIAMLPWPARLTRLWRAMELIVLITAVTAFIMVLGHAYGTSPLYTLPGFSVVALHTAIGLLALSKAVLTVHPRFVLASQLMAPDQAGAEMRRLLPAAILLPCIVGWSLLQGQRQGWYGTEIGLAMFTAANMLVFSTLVWWNSQAVRRGEQRRRDLEGRLADVLNSATDAFITVDAKLRISLFNPAAEKIFGRKAREAIGQPLDLLLPERQRELHVRRIQEYAQTPMEQRAGVLSGLHALRANGEEFPIEASISQVESGGHTLMTVILRDVTERIRTEDALRAHLRRVEAVTEMDRAILGMRSTREIAETALDHLRRMVPCSCASVVVFDRHSGTQRLLAAETCGDGYTPRAHSMSTYEQAQHVDLGTGQDILIGDLRANTTQVALFAQLRQAGAVSYAGLPLRGEQRLLGMLELIDPEPNCFTDQHIQAARSIADQLAIALQQALLKEDVDRHTASLEKRVHERTRELEAMNQELSAANRDLEEFTASAAHDLRAPINAMTGNCRLLRSLIDQHPNEEVRHRMERIEASVRRMDDVIDGMLGLAQLTKVELTRKRIDLNAVAAEVVQELQQQYPLHRVQYQIDCGETICADPRLIRSLLINLIGNAWKYTTRTAAPKVELMRIEADAGPAFVIRDNGVGFDMNYAQHLFEPFHRMHTVAEFPGVGIGLATAARIVQRYGGRIWAESAVGEGAAFYFTLPQAEVTAANGLVAAEQNAD